MGIGSGDAGRLTLWEYQGLLWHWNEMHKPPEEAGKGKAAPPDPDKVRRSLAMANMHLH